MFENSHFSFQSRVTGAPINSGETDLSVSDWKFTSSVEVSREECCGFGGGASFLSCPLLHWPELSPSQKLEEVSYKLSVSFSLRTSHND